MAQVKRMMMIHMMKNIKFNKVKYLLNLQVNLFRKVKLLTEDKILIINIKMITMRKNMMKSMVNRMRRRKVMIMMKWMKMSIEDYMNKWDIIIQI